MATRLQDSADMEKMNEQEIANFIQNLLRQMQDKFEDMTKNVGERVEKMSSKIDDIEKSINDLLKEVNTDQNDG
jgi:heat shock factor-binding protein 1